MLLEKEEKTFLIHLREQRKAKPAKAKRKRSLTQITQISIRKKNMEMKFKSIFRQVSLKKKLKKYQRKIKKLMNTPSQR